MLPIRVLYKNWKGVTRWRRLQPLRIWVGSTEWHKERQTMLTAVDLEDTSTKDFAAKDFIDVIQGDGPLPIDPVPVTHQEQG